MARIERDPRTYAILGAAMEVHKELGRGFLESVYQEAMGIEFRERNIPFEREVELPIHYRGKRLRTSFRADFLCFNEVVVETKALRAITNVEKAQVINISQSDGPESGLASQFRHPLPGIRAPRPVPCKARTPAPTRPRSGR